MSRSIARRWFRLPLVTLTLILFSAAIGIAKTPPLPAALKYSLPKTTIVVDVQVERSKEAPGNYCDFLDLFFPELDVAAACQPKEHANPGDPLFAGRLKTSVTGYSIALKGMPDSTRTFDVSFDASWHIERTDSLTLTEGGTLTGAEMQRTDRTMEIIFGVLSNVAKVAGRFIFGAGPAAPVAEVRADTPPWERSGRLNENFSMLSTSRQQAYKSAWTRPAQRTRLILAMRSYDAIANDAKNLNTILSGVGAQGAQTLIAEIRKQIGDSLAEDFVGSKAKDTWTPTFEITRDAPKPGEQSFDIVLFKVAGCGVTEQTLVPVKNTLAAVKCGKGQNTTAAEVKLTGATASGKPPARLGKPDDTKPDSGILYHIRPEPVVLDLVGACSAGVTLGPDKAPDGTAKPVEDPTTPCAFAKQNTLLAQWGERMSIPKAGKDYAYTVSLYEATGAVKTIKLSSKAALDKATIDNAFSIATTLLDAKDTADAAAKKKADDAAAKADELNVLTRQRQILDEKSKIKKLCDELGLATCES
jgi:hypothetical protein